MKKIIPIILILFLPIMLFSQDTTSIKKQKPGKVIYTDDTFKASRIILGQSIENPPNGVLSLIISHHFGAINSGFYNFFGLDQSSTRLGLEYGINNWLAVGIGRSTYEKTWDGYLKFRILRQSKGARIMPLSLGIFTNITVNTLKLTTDRPDYFDARLSYCTEILLARKFGKIFSLQLTPVWIHKNLVPTPEDHNDIFSLGGGISFRVSETVSLNGEYFYLFPGQHLDEYNNSFSISCDIRTGAHVFQVFMTNSQGNFEEAFITDTQGKWTNGYIYIGFNIHRLFTVKYPKTHKHKEKTSRD